MNPEDLSNDADPRFMTEFYKNLKILSQDLYKKSAAAATIPTGGFSINTNVNAANNLNSLTSASPSSKTFLKKKSFARSSFNSSSQDATVIANAAAAATAAVLGDSGQLSVKLAPSPSNPYINHPADYFTSDSLYERMKLYAEQGGIPLDYIDRYKAQRQQEQSHNQDH